MEDIYILGVHDGHCATASIIKNGKLIACASEERFVNIKNKSGLPKKAIEYCLKEANIKGENLTLIVLASIFMAPISPEENNKIQNKDFLEIYSRVKKIKKVMYRYPDIHDFFYKKFSGFFYNKSANDRKAALSKYLNIPLNKIISLEHHQAHAYCALYGSYFNKEKEDFLILTLDGEGDGLCASVNVVKNGEIKRIAETKNTYSLGLLYLEVTRYLGMKPLEHEYKVMGLAPYANEIYSNECMQLLKDIVYVDGLKFKGKFHSHIYYKVLQKRLKYKRFDVVSGAIQKLTEELLEQWVRNCIKNTGINKIALSGGVFMNVKANLRIMNMKEVNKLFIFPSCGDESLAIGAGYYGYEKVCKDRGIENNMIVLDNLYLGPKFLEKEIKKELKSIKNDKKYTIKFYKNIEEEAVNLLLKGEIVARCSGRMEWGARALGNRSILANASVYKNIKEINEAIKCRDFWMPFAPVIIKEAEHEYLTNPKKIKAPYMIIAFNSKPQTEKDLICAMHPYDKTIRPQIIEKEWNPSYYKIIRLFREKIGIGGLLNTSFNLHGYPIVLGPKEALYVLKNSGLKNLIIENYLIKKK